MRIVYILTNPAFDKYIKIGITNNLSSRLKQLDNTSMPLPYECYFAIEVENANKVEKLLHEAFDKYRVRKIESFLKFYLKVLNQPYN
jgi:hypothetical protein